MLKPIFILPVKKNNFIELNSSLKEAWLKHIEVISALRQKTDN